MVTRLSQAQAKSLIGAEVVLYNNVDKQLFIDSITFDSSNPDGAFFRIVNKANQEMDSFYESELMLGNITHIGLYINDNDTSLVSLSTYLKVCKVV